MRYFDNRGGPMVGHPRHMSETTDKTIRNFETILKKEKLEFRQHQNIAHKQWARKSYEHEGLWATSICMPSWW